MNKIVLTSSATWLFEVIKNVTSSNVPGEKKGSQKLSKSHKAKVTVTLLKEQKIQVLAHPPNSSDLTPCDFWLLPLIKEKLAGRKCSRIHFRTWQSFKVPGNFFIRLSIFFWILVQTTGTVCAKRRSTLMECKCCLFYWPVDITKWTAFVLRLSHEILLFFQRISVGSKSTIPRKHTCAFPMK